MRIQRIKQYVESWQTKGYQDGIPDEVPQVLMKLGLAPSWKAIALALLKNDSNFESLGFTAPISKWYSAFKRVEIEERNRQARLKEVI